MRIAFDHLVLLVHDLDIAARDFAALGFTVLERADTSHGSTRFRFIPFADGSYILLTAFASDDARAGHRLGPVLDAGEGWADYSFVVPDAGAAAEGFAKAGLAARGPVRVANVLAGGGRWALDLLMTGRGAGGDMALPFLVSDVEGRDYRIPGPVRHANGATGIARVAVSTADPDLVTRTLAEVGGSVDAGGVRFGEVVVDVLPLGTPGGRPGGGMVSALLAGGDTREFDTALTHGAHLRMERG